MIYGERSVPEYPEWIHENGMDFTVHKDWFYELDYRESSFGTEVLVFKTKRRDIPNVIETEFLVVYESKDSSDRKFILENLESFLMQEIL